MIFRVFLFVCLLPFSASAASFDLFGSREVASVDLSGFPKWGAVLVRGVQHERIMRASCQPSARQPSAHQPSAGGVPCNWQLWNMLADSVRNVPALKQLQTINAAINRQPYIVDPVNWGMQDYWETPHEFFTRNGDCEDFAITKYKTLKMAGFPASNMRIVVLQDHNLNLLHAVLAVRLGGAEYILDNQIQQVVEDRYIRHYTPIYSINEHGWWRHYAR